MDIRRLEKLDKDKNVRLAQLQEDLQKAETKRDSLNEGLSDLLINGDENEAERRISFMNVQDLKAKKLKEAIVRLEAGHNPYYTDADVYAGFNDYAADYKKQFDKLLAEYMKNVQAAYEARRKLAELRRNAKAVRMSFAGHLENRPGDIAAKMPLATINRTKGSKENIDLRPYSPDYIPLGTNPKDYEEDDIAFGDF